jgi:hypothetical protein
LTCSSNKLKKANWPEPWFWIFSTNIWRAVSEWNSSTRLLVLYGSQLLPGNGKTYLSAMYKSENNSNSKSIFYKNIKSGTNCALFLITVIEL